ncbi:uroporphyrinogen-III synthase [Lysobacter sp. S4-A87]|uniref:uroporphyrinogen-III synthase n=1 Tax=Lysobacter sp. S4-A87 TaxID=2925843 RepID=UPI001F530548|nr:uroporphyrinogen-III synthase [Lysobacter sp. S4-A87]UNK48156.1 uroporphyrinogen-III synthase [Lysobacter sp. S4-A87]
MISLRPRGEHAALRRAAARVGAGFVALSPWQLRLRDDEATREALRIATQATRVVVTSPTAVRAARSLQALHARPGQQWFAVGAGTAAALRRAGVADVAAPTRMDSEGLLALPGLQDLAGSALGFISAPGGRGVLVPALQARGARVLRADVYDRVAITPSTRAVNQLLALAAPSVVALSSGDAIETILNALPAPARERLLQSSVVAASERLAGLARQQGFADVAVARSARPQDLLAAAPINGQGRQTRQRRA